MTVPPNFEPTYGALLIGVFFSIFFQGILTMQAYLYYGAYPNDSLRLKALVAAVWTLDTVHLGLICQAVYYYLVQNWGNEAALLETITQLDLHLALLSIVTIICQGFFLSRVWTFSNKNRPLTAILFAACLFTLILDTIMSAQTIGNKSIATILSHTFEWEVITVFTVGAAVDLSIALILCWYLQRERSAIAKRVLVSPRRVSSDILTSTSANSLMTRISTRSLIARVIQYTVATGLSTSLLALGCLIAYVAAPNSLIFLGMHFSLGRLYSNALLATLNTRRSLGTIARSSLQVSWAPDSPTSSDPVFARRAQLLTPTFAQDIPLRTQSGRALTASPKSALDAETESHTPESTAKGWHEMEHATPDGTV